MYSWHVCGVINLLQPWYKTYYLKFSFNAKLPLWLLSQWGIEYADSVPCWGLELPLSQKGVSWLWHKSILVSEASILRYLQMRNTALFSLLLGPFEPELVIAVRYDRKDLYKNYSFSILLFAKKNPCETTSQKYVNINVPGMQFTNVSA